MIDTLRGAAVVQIDGDARRQPAAVGQYLRVGGMLRTGSDAEAHLRLRNGGHLTVKPASLVTFSTAPAANRELALELTRGSVVGNTASKEAGELVIAMGRRSVRLAQQARATIAVPVEGAPTLSVELGAATVTAPDGKQRQVIAGAPITLVSRPRPPDAAVPDAAVVRAPELLFYVTARGRGAVLVKLPDQTRFTRLARGRPIAVALGSELRVDRRSAALVGAEPSGGTLVRGPARLAVRAAAAGAAGAPPALEITGNGSLQVSREGEPDRRAAPFTVQGVTVTPRVRHKRVDVRVRAERTQAVVSVTSGAARLASTDRVVDAEAGQRATLSRGRISGPQTPAVAPVEINRPGRTRVFTGRRLNPVTLRWKLPAGATEAIVEASRHASLDQPLFADRITRTRLTLPQVPRGRLFWRVRPIDARGQLVGKPLRGQLAMIKDTSHRLLKRRRAMNNTIHLRSETTTVFYQNVVPRFTLTWPRMDGATSYHVKVLREQNLARPLVNERVPRATLRLKPGALGEGSYLWYVVGRDARGEIVKASGSRRLTIAYDNATPDLQIKHPRDGSVVSGVDLEVSGVTIRGSSVTINGQAVTLDNTFRFTHPLKLHPGANVIVLRVIDRYRRRTIYLRHVTVK